MLGGRAGLVVVVHKVVAPALAGIAAVGAPIVEHAVAQVDQLGRHIAVSPEPRAAHARVARVVMQNQIVVERCALATPDTAVAVRALVVHRVAQALAQDAPLHREVLVVVERRTLVGAPRHRAVVQNDVLLVASPDGVVLGRFLVAHSEADEADDDVVGADIGRIVLEADAVAGSRLARNGHIAILDAELRLQFDSARHVEDYDAGAACRQSLSQRTGAAVVQIGHVDNFSTSTAGHIPAAAPGTRERVNLLSCNARRKHNKQYE